MIDISLLGFLAAVALAIVRLRNLFAVVMLSGIYSLLSAGIFVQLDAVEDWTEPVPVEFPDSPPLRGPGGWLRGSGCAGWPGPAPSR